MFIVFEGPDHAGKSTLVKKFVEYYTEKGSNILLTREPGGTPVGEKIREIIKDPNNEMNSLCEEFLFAAQRAQHCEFIKEKLLENCNVVTDRFVQSSYIYQGVCQENLALVYNINNVAMQKLKPDLIIMITCTPEEAMRRSGPNDRMELKMDVKRIYEAYEELMEEESESIDEPDWIRVDTTNKSVEESFEELLKLFKPYEINLLA